MPVLLSIQTTKKVQGHTVSVRNIPLRLQLPAALSYCPEIALSETTGITGISLSTYIDHV